MTWPVNYGDNVYYCTRASHPMSNPLPMDTMRQCFQQGDQLADSGKLATSAADVKEVSGATVAGLPGTAYRKRDPLPVDTAQ
jgi:hypothetical protein